MEHPKGLRLRHDTASVHIHAYPSLAPAIITLPPGRECNAIKAGYCGPWASDPFWHSISGSTASEWTFVY